MSSSRHLLQLLIATSSCSNISSHDLREWMEVGREGGKEREGEEGGKEREGEEGKREGEGEEGKREGEGGEREREGEGRKRGGRTLFVALGTCTIVLRRIWKACISLVPRPPLFFVLRFAFSILHKTEEHENGEGLGTPIT